MNRMDNIVSNLLISIDCCFDIEHDSDWKERKMKADYTFWCVKKGNIYIQINNKQYKAGSNTVIFFYPGNEYRAYTDAEGCEFMVFRFKLEMGNSMDLLCDSNLAGIICGLSEETENLCRIFRNYAHGLESGTIDHYFCFAAFLNKIINIQKNEQGILFYKDMEQNQKSAVQISIDHILENYRTITVRQAASYVHLSEKRFILNFKKAVGISPGQYILKCKMRHAVKMLCNTNMKILEISSCLGYSDQYSFSKAFKNYYGESPNAFRKNKLS